MARSGLRGAASIVSLSFHMSTLLSGLSACTVLGQGLSQAQGLPLLLAAGPSWGGQLPQRSPTLRWLMAFAPTSPAVEFGGVTGKSVILPIPVSAVPQDCLGL